MKLVDYYQTKTNPKRTTAFDCTANGGDCFKITITQSNFTNFQFGVPLKSTLDLTNSANGM